MDNNKVPHKDPRVVDKMLERMKDYFGNLAITRGKEQQFIGIYFKICEDDKVELSAKSHIQSAILLIEELGEKLDDGVSTPVAWNLFDVHKSKRLSEKKAEVFHSCTTKNLYITKQVRPDIETTVSYLCT